MKTAEEILHELLQQQEALILFKNDQAYTKDTVLKAMETYHAQFSKENEGRANKEDMLIKKAKEFLFEQPEVCKDYIIAIKNAGGDIISRIMADFAIQHTSPIPELSDEEIEKELLDGVSNDDPVISQVRIQMGGAKWYRNWLRSKIGQHNNQKG